MSSYEFLIEGQAVETTAEKVGAGFEVTVDGDSFTVLPLGNGKFSVESNGSKVVASGVAGREMLLVEIGSRVYEFREKSEEGVAAGAGDHDAQPDKIFAPMPGKIVKLMVKVGDQVALKQQAVIVEAMKMENPVLTRAAGKVKAVHFEVGDQVDTEKPIIELEIEE